MLRGGFPTAPNLNLNYAAYFSTLSTNATLASDRQVGGRLGAFLPKQRIEIGFSVQHLLQESHANRLGAHFEWQPRSLPLDIRSEFADSESGRGYWIEPALRLSAVSHAPVFAHTQLVGRFSTILHQVRCDQRLCSRGRHERARGRTELLLSGWTAGHGQLWPAAQFRRQRQYLDRRGDLSVAFPSDEGVTNANPRYGSDSCRDSRCGVWQKLVRSQGHCSAVVVSSVASSVAAPSVAAPPTAAAKQAVRVEGEKRFRTNCGRCPHASAQISAKNDGDHRSPHARPSPHHG